MSVEATAGTGEPHNVTALGSSFEANLSKVEILLVDDSPKDLLQLQSVFADITSAQVRVTAADSLGKALSEIDSAYFDLILLDLSLPDSRGVDTFVRVNDRARDVPVLVLTSSEDLQDGEVAVQRGALDCFEKTEVSRNWFGKCIRYAVERAALQRELRGARERERRNQELELVGRLSSSVGTEVTSQLYAAMPLREALPAQFTNAVSEYERVLDLAIERRIHRGESPLDEALQELSDSLGFLRAGPRDVVDIHVSALRIRFTNAKPEKANAYLEEGRVTLLELMGNLVTYYRSYYTPTIHQRGP